MKKNIIFVFILTLSLIDIYAQTTYNVRSRVSGLEHNFQCGNDVGTGNPDPRWKLWWAYDAGTFTAFTAGADYCSDVYGGNGFSCGLDNSYNLQTSEFNNTTISQFNLDMECWEEDGCGTGTQDCSAGGNGLCNADDIQTPRGRIADINYRNQPPCSEHNWGVFYRIGPPDNYGAEVRINWSYHTVNPADIGTIDPAGENICSGDDPTMINSVTPGLPHTTYQWQYSDNNGGLWTDVVGGTSASYDPPVLSATRWYRRKETICQGNTIATSVSVDYYTNIYIITVETSSTVPSTITSSPANLCGSGTVNLTANGGALGGGAQYEWFDDFCGGNLIGTTVTNVLNSVALSASTTYFVRISGNCNTTTCVQATVNVSAPSTAPTGATASSTLICSGSNVTLSVVGGSLGTSSTWEWYDIGCGSGINVGSGASISVSPTTTTTYFVRAEGGCAPTTCESVTVTVEQPSTDPTSASASPASYCTGGSSTLTVNGGSLGTGADWVWYEAGCALGTPVGNGLSISVSPLVTTTYFVRAEGNCNNTSCTSVTVTVNQSGADPTSIAAGNTNLCPGQSTVLSVVGGSLGTGATWEWYSGSCGGIPVGQGNTISVSPTSNTTYFVRAEGTCGNSACASVAITVGVGTADPTAATVINDNICPGDTAQVFVTGGVLPAGYTWVWYTGTCGAIPIGIGDTISVTPNATTTYYVRATGTCGNTNCTSATVTVLPGSVAATGVLFDNNNFCPGESATLTVDGGSLVAGAQWIWYENGCGGTSIGTGNSLTVTPSSTTSYYVRAEGGTCGNTSCANVSINVSDAYAYMVPFDTECGIGQAFTLNNGLPEGGTYSGTGVSGNIFDPAVAGEGTHSITYTFVADNGCVASATADIQINASTIVASAVTEIESCSDGGVTVVVTATGGSGFYNYKWSNGQTGNPLTYVEPGTYSVTVIDGEDCATTVSDIVVDASQSCIQVANTFTPNGDGMNDTWNLDFTAYSNANLQVFSKWGTLVYQTDATSIQWDGTDLNGSNLPAGTYYYIIELDGGSITQNGPISIVR